MSKREVDSREEDQRKRQKCDISDDPLNLWPQLEELEEPTSFFETDEGSPPCFGSICQFLDDGSMQKSSQSSSSSSDSAIRLSVPPTREVFLNFLRTVSTSEWNLKENASLVFKHFQIRPYIVHPEHFLSKFYESDYEGNRISNILKKEGFGVPWSMLEKSVDEFIAVYECEGLEELADIHADRSQQVHVQKLLSAFEKKLHELNQIPWTHSELHFLVRLMIERNESGRRLEELFEQYVRFLINFIQGNLSMFQSKITLQLGFPKCKGFKEFERDVIPDIVVVSRIGRKKNIVLVGEIKTVGSHGRRFESHKGKKIKGVKKSSDKRDREKVELVTSTSIADTSDETYPGTEADFEETLVEDEEPDHADAVKEKKEDILRKEKYKVRCYLPQLLSQMIAAMQSNSLSAMQHNKKEQYQIGFAVEGWKLRFVKLVVRDYLDQFNGPKKPAFVQELLEGKPFKCDVYITQEFNLLKGRDVTLFFKMLVAISCNNALELI